MRLKDKVVLVTASTRGIGLATVQACAKEGAIVYMAARNLERASQRAEELNAMGYRVRTVYNDATDLESYRTMIEEVLSWRAGSTCWSTISAPPIPRQI